MAEIGITNLEAGKAGCETLKGAAQNADSMRQTATSAFNELTSFNPDLGSHFISELTSSLNDIYNFLNGNLYSAAELYFQDENVVTPAVPGGISGNHGGSPYDGGGGGNEGGHNGQEVPQSNEPPTVPPTVPSTIPNTQPIPAVDLESINTSSLTEAQLDEINGIVDELIDLANQNNGYLDEVLQSDVNSDKIKELLLKSPYVPQELKAIIKDLDSKIVRQLLEYILKGNSPEIFDLNTLNLGITYTYLDEIAKQHNMSVQDLIGKTENAKILRDELAKFGDVVDLIKGWEELSNEDFQEQLKTFYYGDVSEEFPDQDVTVTRAYVDYLAKACDVGYEEFLNDSSYAETLKEGAIEFGKSATFFKSASFFSDSGLTTTIKSIFDGTNYKVFGMNKDSIDSFKKEIDNVAKENNVSSEKLLSESSYSDIVKDALLKSDSASGVGFIYKESNSSVSQEVAKNVYNTKIENKK